MLLAQSEGILYMPELLLGIPVPPIPKPANADDTPDSPSASIIVATNDATKLLLWYNSKHSSDEGWVDSTHEIGPWYSGLPPNYQLQYRRYWQLLDYQRMGGGVSFDKTVSVTNGVSTTDAVSMSAELGIVEDGLSAKLSTTFSHSVTVSESQTVSYTWQATGAPGKITVFILWQLCEEFIAVDESGNELAGQWDGWVTDRSSGDGCECSLNYPTTHMVSQTTMYAPDSTEFDA
jgi:hypothetical protein